MSPEQEKIPKAEGGEDVRRIKQRFIATPVGPDKTKHWFEAEYDERPSPSHPGEVESSLVPGTLKDLGPVSPEEQ